MNWELAFTTSPDQVKEYKTVEDLRKSGLNVMKASVPGCFENDLVLNGYEKDFYYGTNILNARKYESTHVYYFAEFNAFENDCLHFECVDTVAEIFINGILTCECDNMFTEYVVSENIVEGKNQVVVHIIPPSVAAEQYSLPEYCFANEYTRESLYVRKAPHQFGWDIAPRLLTKGLLKPVLLLRKRKCEISNAYIRTKSVDFFEENAAVAFSCDVEIRQDCQHDFKQLNYVAEIRDEKRVYSQAGDLHGSRIDAVVEIPRAKLWWPRNYGKPFLYDAAIKIFDGQKLLCQFDSRIGIRTVELVTGPAPKLYPPGSDNDPDEFYFKINGKRVFLLGTNWVPLDAMHVGEEERLTKAFNSVVDLGCNVIRCWGGNVYESDEFYELCDENGVLVWQDFAMACAVYPRDKKFAAMISKEAEYQVKRLRNHASLLIFSGDNECDLAAYSWSGNNEIPDRNTVTREVLKGICRNLAPELPYIPSSPYLSGREPDLARLPEDHLWGPRDYFKSDFYRNNKARFVSETGYFGMPSPSSIKRFIPRDKQWPLRDEQGRFSNEYILHETALALSQDGIFTDRLPLLIRQVEVLFGSVPEKYILFLRQSQISQAEAFKYFIERQRVRKGYSSGIIWWNLLDCWPQISDAIIDYYFTKKLAYGYVKRSQNPLCLIFDEKDNSGRYALHAVNDLQYGDQITYVIKDITENGKIIASGIAEIKPDSNEILENLLLESKHFYQMTWTPRAGKTYTNHFFTELTDIDYTSYISAIRKTGYNEFEGFDDMSKD